MPQLTRVLSATPSDHPPSRTPALLFCHEATAGIRVAALTLLDRLVVAAHRGGAGPITIVVANGPPVLKRTTALGIPARIVTAPPPRDAAMLVASSDLLVQAADVRALLDHGGRLAGADGTPLPIGVLPGGDAPWQTALAGLPALRARGVACRITDAVSARRAEQALWASLTSASDGFVDRVFNRPCGRVLSKVLVHTPVSPNAVSLISIGIGLVAAGLFAVGNHPTAVCAAVLFQLSAIVDCVDGDLARVLFKESALGKWLDLAGDQVVHVAVFAAIAAGCARRGQLPSALWLGLSAVAGALLSFAVIVRGMKRPARDRSRLLQKLIDSATNRDFSVLVLLLACVNRLDWFLWMAAIGSHLFWMVALALQAGSRGKDRSVA